MGVVISSEMFFSNWLDIQGDWRDSDVKFLQFQRRIWTLGHIITLAMLAELPFTSNRQKAKKKVIATLPKGVPGFNHNA